MPSRDALANLSYTVDSASEDESHDVLNAMPTPDSNAENKAPARNSRGKVAQTAKSAPVTKTGVKARAATRRASGGTVLGLKKQNAAIAKKTTGAKGGRKALVERSNANMSDTEEVDEFAAEDEIVHPVDEPKPNRRGRPAKSKKVQEDDSVAEVTSPPPKKSRKAADTELAPKRAPKAKAATKGKAAHRAPEPEPEAETTILETQQDPDLMDVEQSIEIDEIPESIAPQPIPRAAARIAAPRASSKQPIIARGRAGSASDSERDPAIRRRLGEVTKKLEAMTMKYENLKDAASSTKESNFEQLRRRTEQTAKNQEALIKALKQQISEMQSRSSELDSIKKNLAKLEKENTRLASDNKTLTASLTTSQNENKTLQTKLAAARSSVPPEGKPVPGSAVKPRSAVLSGTAEAAKEAQLQQLKVDLYSDLTNLVIRGVKKNEEGDDMFDCLQTGRNGTLHFHLSVAADSESPYDETEFAYIPQLDESRDRELLELLPEYMTEEIVFPRSHVARFYTKVIDTMSKKIVFEE